MQNFLEYFISYLFTLVGKTKVIKDVCVKNMFTEITIDKKYLVSFSTILKCHSMLKFNILSDICSIDKPGKRLRFTVFYNFFSLCTNMRVLICVQTREGAPIESLVDLFECS